MIANSTSAWIAVVFLSGASLVAQDSLGSLSRQGNDLIAKKSLPEAEKFFRGAVEQARAAGDKIWQAEFERAIGETYERRFEYGNAKTHYQRSLELRLELPAAEENRKQIARLYAGTALMSVYLRDDQEAHSRARKAIAAYHELGDRNLEARNLNLLGSILLNRGELEEATKAVEEAHSLYQALGDKAGVVGAMLRLADFNYRRGGYRAALRWAFEAQTKLKETADPRLEAEILEILGNVFSKMQQQDKSLAYHRACLQLRLKLNNTRSLATTYGNLGAILGSKGDFEGALVETLRAIELRRKLANPAELALNLNNLGLIQMNLGRNAEAAATFHESLEISKKHGYLREAATPNDALGTLARREGKVAEALDRHRAALRIREQLKDRLGMVNSYTNIATDLEVDGNLSGSIAQLEMALGVWNELVSQVADPSQVGSFRGAAASLYPKYAQALMKTGKTAESFAISELARGAGLSRMTRLNKVNFTELLEPSERVSWQAAAATLARAANRLRVVTDAKKGDQEEADAEAAYYQAEQEMGKLRDQLFAANAKLRTEDSSPLDIRAMKAYAKANPGALLVSWMILDERSSLLFTASNKEGIQVSELPAGRKAIQEATQAWLVSIGRRQGRGVAVWQEKAVAPERELAHRLYELVLGPVRQKIEHGGFQRLVLLPDGGLSRIPFAALMDGRGKRLLEGFEITSSVNFRNLLSPAAQMRGKSSLYALGDPLLASEDRLVAPFGARFQSLPHARAEAIALAKYFPGTKAVLGQDAREAEVKRKIGSASILHFATHGVLDSQNGLRSGLLLSTEPEDSPEDGLLQAWEISGIALAARLAVLSACDTGQGDEQLGEGVIGLAWAFQAAGCPNVIASLWSVDDAAAKHLMQAFYRHIKARLSIQAALRQAMLETAKMPGFADPYYWAPFQMIGPGGAA